MPRLGLATGSQVKMLRLVALRRVRILPASHNSAPMASPVFWSTAYFSTVPDQSEVSKLALKASVLAVMIGSDTVAAVVVARRAVMVLTMSTSASASSAGLLDTKNLPRLLIAACHMSSILRPSSVPGSGTGHWTEADDAAEPRSLA